MARVGLVSYYRWVRVKNPYKVITEDDGSVTLELSGNFETFAWNRWNTTSFSLTAEQSQKQIYISNTGGKIYPCYVSYKTFQDTINDLATLRTMYSEFLK